MDAPAEPVEVAQQASFTPRPFAGHAVVDVRLGVLRTDATPHPYVCLEVGPTAWLTVEGCGTGSGFLYPSDGPDLAHFRARARVLHAEGARLEGLAAVGAGIVEADRGEDAPGFRFDEGDATEGAGPELSLSAQSRLWFHPRAFLVGDLTGSVAWVPAAPVVLGTPGPFVGSAALTVGAGF